MVPAIGGDVGVAHVFGAQGTGREGIVVSVLRELGQAFGVSRSGVCMASGRIKERAATDKKLRKVLDTAVKLLRETDL